MKTIPLIRVNRVDRRPLAITRSMCNRQRESHFKLETEETEWWHKNRAWLDKHLVDAAKKGTLKRLDTATLKARLTTSKSSGLHQTLRQAK